MNQVDWTGISTKCLLCDNCVAVEKNDAENLERGFFLPAQVCPECISAIASLKNMLNANEHKGVDRKRSITVKEWVSFNHMEDLSMLMCYTQSNYEHYSPSKHEGELISSVYIQDDGLVILYCSETPVNKL